MELIELGEGNINSLFDTRKDPTEMWENAVVYSSLHEHSWCIL